MSRSNYGKPFYVDVGTSIVAIRCASNHDVLVQYDFAWNPPTLHLAKGICDRMNREAEIGRPLRNCDVGTAEEQYGRWKIFCGRHGDDCTGCPCEKAANVSFTACFACWSQMPYEENKTKGGAK